MSEEDQIRNIITYACSAHSNTGEASFSIEARRIMLALEEKGFVITKKDEAVDFYLWTQDEFAKQPIEVRRLRSIAIPPEAKPTELSSRQDGVSRRVYEESVRRMYHNEFKKGKDE